MSNYNLGPFRDLRFFLKDIKFQCFYALTFITECSIKRGFIYSIGINTLGSYLVTYITRISLNGESPKYNEVDEVIRL